MSTYILKPDTVPQILDITEHMSACYGFDLKEAMRLRLLCEEMIASVYSGLVLAPGELHFNVSDAMFTVTATVSAEVRGMPKEHRKKLLETFKPPKKSGLFGFIQDFMDEMALSEEEISLSRYMGIHYNAHAGMSMTPYTMHMDELSQFAAIPSRTPKQIENNKEQEIEINLLKGLADDIKVVHKHGRFEISVMKKIPSEFLNNFLVIK